MGMTYLVTCNYEWDDQDEFQSEAEAETWMLKHERETEHASFRVWINTDDARVVRAATHLQMKSAEAGKDAWLDKA